MDKSFLLIRKKGSLLFPQRDDVESDLDSTDDSASSYYSTFCSLSAYSEGPDTRTHTECPAEEKSSKQLDYYSSVDDIIPKSFPAHEYNLQDCKDSEELPMISQPEQDGDNEYHQPMGRTVTNEEQNPDNTDELNTSKIHQELSVNCRDVSGGGLTACHIFTRTAEHSSSEPKFSSNHQCSKGKEQKSHGAHPRENQLTQRERPREGLHGPECRLEGGGDILGHMQMKEDGQDRVVSCRKEQPELSLSSRNREGAAKSLSTLTATKQNSRIPSYCYSECIPATIHQHQLKRFADTQSQQGAWQSRPLSLMLCRSTEDQTSGTTSMGTKQAEPSSEVEGLANLVQVRSSCSGSDYMHVLSSSGVPSGQCNRNKWTEDLLSFNMQMSSETQNTSACSETSSFECVDVALETKDEVKRGLKTVPKRQIQLKRRDTAEDEGNENNCQTYKGLHPRDLLQRQHSTPAAINQGSHDRDQRAAQAERKQKLQKSFSLDETFCKTQVASSIITNILSKKMQHEQNLRSLDVSDKAFASVNVSNRTITREELATKPNDTPNREPQGESISSQKYCSSNSKKQPKPLGKNGLAPLLSGIGISQVHCSGTEITITSENEKAEKTSPREATLLLPNLNPRVRVSCDSAKGSSWNSSAATNVAICTQASVKTTPEESHTGQGFHEQHNITQISEMKNKEQKAGSMQSTLSPTNVACLISDLEAATEDSTTFKSDDSNVGKEQVKTQGQIPNLVIQTQGKPKAPMHVVRDMRSLVKNTYNMANKSQGDSSQGLDKTASLLQPPQHNLSNKGERKGSRQEEKTLLRKVTPPLPLDRRRDHSATRGRSTMAKPLVESGDKCHIVGYKKVSPIGVTKFASSNPTETLDGKVSIKKPEALVTDPNWTKTNRTELALQQEDSTNINKMVQEISTLSHKDELQYFSASTSGLDDQNRLTQDGLQTPCLQPRSQGSTGPLPACVLTVASTPMVPSYFYKPSLLGYQSISSNMGALHGYVQGPVLFQTPLYNQTTASNCQTPLESKNLVSPTNQTQNQGVELKVPSPESHYNTIFVTPMSDESRLGGTTIMYPQTGSVATGQTPQQLFLDPETGHYFCVDMPQLPQRKMLFDPETCQYVEVLLPQQTFPRAVLSTPCTIPFPPLHMPPMYNPQCVSYVQSQQMFPQPGP